MFVVKLVLRDGKTKIINPPADPTQTGLSRFRHCLEIIRAADRAENLRLVRPEGPPEPPAA